MSQAATAAPELLPSLQWLNAEPQAIAGHRGRVLALVFWNASSAYCHNLIDELVRLQARFPLGLSLVGIHQPKFDSELDGRLVLKTANRLGVPFPVANDRAWTTWQHYGIQSWPSVALIDTRGRLRQVLAGDHQGAALDAAITNLIDEVGGAVVPAQPGRRSGAEPRLPLAFPSGLAVGENHLYVADTGHHRILECTHSGRILREFGTGHGDLVDGPPEDAAFRNPRGLCLVREALYVADTGNHALRRIRLLDGAVETVLGNGRPGQVREGANEAAARLPLNQPWDVTGSQDRLFIAMAGSNQIWEYDLSQTRLKLLAGSGELGILDGPVRNAMFAHPAGLAQVQQTLYVADSATSAIRAVQITQASPDPGGAGPVRIRRTRRPASRRPHAVADGPRPGPRFAAAVGGGQLQRQPAQAAPGRRRDEHARLAAAAGPARRTGGRRRLPVDRQQRCPRSAAL